MAQCAITRPELEADRARQEVTFVQAMHAMERRLEHQMHALERRMYATAAIVGGLGVAILGILITL